MSFMDTVWEKHEALKEKERKLREDKTIDELAQRFEDALLVIENIAVHQEDLPHNLNTEKEQELHNAITTIYKIAHTARLPGCFERHLGWEDQFQALRKEISD